MPIQVWLARMERPLTEQEYGDMIALLPDARRERLEKLPKEKHQEVLCAYLLLADGAVGAAQLAGSSPDRGR